MALKIVGVKAVVQNFSTFMNNIRAVGKAEEDVGKKINNSLQRQELMRKKLGLQIKAQGAALDKLESAQKVNIDKVDMASVKLELLKNASEKAGISADALKTALAASTGTIASLSAALATLGPIIAVVGAAIALIVIQFKIWKKMLQVVTAPLRLLTKGVATLGKTIITQGIPALITFGKWLGGILVNRVKAVLSVIGKLASMIGGKFVSALKTLASTIANVVVNGFKRLGEAIKGAIKIAAEGAATFQKLEIRFQGLVANEIIATGRTDDFSTAMAIAATEGKNLLEWIQKLAITTPFTRRDISETVAFSMAMGFTIKQTKEMTLAIGNFVSGMGLSSDVMERIVLQFGQMQAGGKLFGTELRDLARGAFVPVNEIIKEVAANLDMTATEWQDLAARGETDIMPFFDEFINMANTRFPGAMDRMNKTLEAVMQNLGEFVREFLGVKLLLPTVNRISDAISKAFDSITTPAIMKAFEMAGKSIWHLTNTFLNLLKVVLAIKPPMEEVVRVMSLGGDKVGTVTGKLGETIKVIGGVTSGLREVREVTKSSLGTFQQWAVNIAAFISVAADKIRGLLVKVTNWVKGMGGDFATMAKDALKWGTDVMVNFAIGMVQGASTALVQAMNAISGMLSWWLESFSPPRVAPDIIKWGAGAVTEWLRGFTQADFGILKSIQSPLKSALDVLLGRGDIGEKGMREKFINISKGLIEGLSGGKIGSGVTSAIAGLAEFGPELNKLIQLELQLADATDRVREAEEALEQARKKFADSTIKVREETMKYNRLLRAGAGEEQLRAQLAVLNATEEERNVAQEQIGIQEDNLEAAEDALDPLQEAVSLQKQLIDQLLELAKMSILPKDSVNDLKDALGSVGGAIDDIGDSIEETGKQGKSALQQQGGLTQAFEDAKDKIEKAWGSLFDRVGKKWDNTVGAALGELKTKFDEFRKNVIFPVLDALGIEHEGASRGISGEPSELETRIREIITVAREMYDFWIGDLKTALSEFFGEGGILTQLSTSFGDLSEAVGNLASTLGLGAESSGGEEGGPLTKAIWAVGNFFLWLMDDVLTPLMVKLDEVIIKLQGVKTWLDNIKSAWSGVTGALGEAMLGALGIPADYEPWGGTPPGHAEGSFRIPRNELAYLHKNEMVIPAKIAAQVRASLTSVPAPMATSNRTSNVSFGDTHINNGMDMAMMGVQVERALVNTL